MTKFFEEFGLRCVLRAGGLGIPCGYVLAPAEFGSSNELEVHGGVTWDGEMEELGPGRWIGFDAGHYGDSLPPFPGGEPRDDNYMRGQCKRLAQQISEASDVDR
jgi:hypothetical protein